MFASLLRRSRCLPRVLAAVPVGSTRALVVALRFAASSALAGTWRAVATIVDANLSQALPRP
jgi:hypothetical protein